MNTCRTCNTEIPPTGKRGRPAAYCGDACRPTSPVRVPGADTIKVCTCQTCGQTFDRPGTRGRIPKACPTCKVTERPDATATVRASAKASLTDFDVATMSVGHLVKLVSEVGTFKVMTTDLGSDGSVLLYGGRGYRPGRSNVYAQYRSVMPCDVLGCLA